MGMFLGTGFFFYMLFLSLMASQCYIELKRFSKRVSERDYVGLMDLIDECCNSNVSTTSPLSPFSMLCIKSYFKFVAIQTLVMLLASN